MMNSDSYFINRFGYTCPICHKENSLFLDELVSKFNGCQSEFLSCYNCDCRIYVKVRYNKIVKILTDKGD